MPDDRFFHKRLGHSEKVNRLTDFEYIVWHAYILSADDFGVMRFSAAALCSDHDRLERRPAKAVQKALERIRDAGLIGTFQHQGRDYCYQRDWQEWQKIDYPRSTIHPAPPLEHLSEKTRELLAKHPGGWGRRVKGTLADGSPNVPKTDPEPFGKRSGEISPKPLANSHKPVAESQSRGGKLAYDGRFLTVFRWQHTELGKRLAAGQREDFDLTRWFERLEADMERAVLVAPADDRERWDWLLKRLYVDAELPQPNLMGRTKTSGNVASAQRFVDRGIA